MKLNEYFDKAKGFGVIATSNCEGEVNTATIPKPIIMDDGTAAFLMPGHLTYQNLQSNPRASFYFMEQSNGNGCRNGSGNGTCVTGKRLNLTKVNEDESMELIEVLRKKRYPIFTVKYSNESKYVVFFSVDEEHPLVDGGLVIGSNNGNN